MPPEVLRIMTPSLACLLRAHSDSPQSVAMATRWHALVDAREEAEQQLDALWGLRNIRRAWDSEAESSD